MRKMFAIVAAAAFLGGCATPMGAPGTGPVAAAPDTGWISNAEWIRMHYGTRA